MELFIYTLFVGVAVVFVVDGWSFCLFFSAYATAPDLVFHALKPHL